MNNNLDLGPNEHNPLAMKVASRTEEPVVDTKQPEDHAQPGQSSVVSSLADAQDPSPPVAQAVGVQDAHNGVRESASEEQAPVAIVTQKIASMTLEAKGNHGHRTRAKTGTPIAQPNRVVMPLIPASIIREKSKAAAAAAIPSDSVARNLVKYPNIKVERPIEGPDGSMNAYVLSDLVSWIHGLTVTSAGNSMEKSSSEMTVNYNVGAALHYVSLIPHTSVWR